MRKLKGTDVFAALRVVNLAGVREEVVRMTNVSKDGQVKLNAQEIGVEVILNIIAHAASKEAEQAIFEFLGGPLEATPEELADRDLDALIEDIKAAVELNKGVLGPFFKSLAGLMK